jgi:hypothetical protein
MIWFGYLKNSRSLDPVLRILHTLEICPWLTCVPAPVAGFFFAGLPIAAVSKASRARRLDMFLIQTACGSACCLWTPTPNPVFKVYC